MLKLVMPLSEEVQKASIDGFYGYCVLHLLPKRARENFCDRMQSSNLRQLMLIGSQFYDTKTKSNGEKPIKISLFSSSLFATVPGLYSPVDR